MIPIQELYISLLYNIGAVSSWFSTVVEFYYWPQVGPISRVNQHR